MQSLMQHPGWERLVKVIDQKITAGRDAMETTGRDIDLQRGGLKALRMVKGLPQYAIERAAAELKLHRGE
jgi:hypothetical protein